MKLNLHTPTPRPEPDEDEPERKRREPGVPPDREPVIPQKEPPAPGRTGDVPDEPPPIIAVNPIAVGFDITLRRTGIGGSCTFMGPKEPLMSADRLGSGFQTRR